MGLAEQYPGDVNIQNDPSVLFVEKFDDVVKALKFPVPQFACT